MKEGWTYKKLGELCYISTGKHDANHAKEEGAYRFYTCASQYVYCDTFSFDGDCLILPGNGANVGEVYKFSGKFDAYQRTYVLSNIKKEEISFGYLYYYFLGNWKKQGSAKQYGAATNYIIMGNFTGFTIKYPVLSEQKRIVERLDAAFENIDKLKANAEKQLAEAQTLFQKSLAKAMEPKEGWEEKTLGQLVDLKNGMNFAHNEKGVDLHILGVGDFGNRFSIDDVRELQMISLNQQPSEDYLLKDGDIVFVRSNGNKQLVGRSLVVYPGDNSTTFSGFCIRFRKSLKVLDERFLVYLLKSDNTRKKLFGNGANISNLNQKTLQSLIVPLPPLAEQQRIVERLDTLSENIRKYEEIQRQIISECDALKQALLRKVFE